MSVTDRVDDDERFVDKPGHQIEHVVVIDSVADADVLGSLECPAACEASRAAAATGARRR